MAVHAIRAAPGCPAALDAPVSDCRYPADVEILDGLFGLSAPVEYQEDCKVGAEQMLSDGERIRRVIYTDLSIN